MCLVAWPLNESEAGVDLVLIESSRGFNPFLFFFWYYFGRPSFLGRSMPPGNVEILDSHRCLFLYFEVYCHFALLILDVNQFAQIWRQKKLNIYSNRFLNDALFIDAKRSIISKLITTESWPFQCPQLMLGRIIFVRSLLF